MSDNKSITVQGIVVEVAQPYLAGHTITEAEAKALNQVRAENIGNNIRKAIIDLKEKVTDEKELQKQAQALVTEKDASYVFTLASVGGRQSLDPLTKECQSIARAFIAGKLKEKGITQKAYTDKHGEDAIKTKVAEIMDHPEIVKAAKKALAERQKMAEIDLSM